MPGDLAGEDVLLIRRVPNGQDTDGNDSWALRYETVPGAMVWERGSQELTGQRDTVVEGLSALLPAGTAVAATDRVRVRGVEYEVDGAPVTWRSPLTGYDGGVQVTLTRVTG